MNLSQQMKLLELIEAYSNAKAELAFAGAGQPEERADLEADLSTAYNEMTAYIQELTE